MLSPVVPRDAGAQATTPASAVTVRESRPRLLIGPEDIPRLRIRCGIPSERRHPLAVSGEISLGSHADDFERLRRFTDASLAHDPLPGTLYAPALLHLLIGKRGEPDRYTAYVTRHLTRQLRFGVGVDDAIVALDWCFEALPPNEREVVVANLVASLKPLGPRDTPLDHISFHARLCSLAGAITLHAANGLRPSREKRVREVLTAAAPFLESRFVRILNERGATATSPSAAAEENADACFAVEIWRTGTGRNLWPRLADSLGRCCEPYFWTRTEYTDPGHGFLHDTGTASPPAPGLGGWGYTPAVPLVVAKQARDPIAAWFAQPRHRVTTGKPSQTLLFEHDRHLWMKILYAGVKAPAAQRIVCPLGRNLGDGWVAMRSGWDARAVVVLFDAGQPHLRSRQHFDAGQFQVFHQGMLACDGADDVGLEAVASKGGKAYINLRLADWDLCAQATIAHNCITVYEAAGTMRRHGPDWPAVANQRVIRRDYDGSKPLAETGRATGRLLAFETSAAYSYAAADLSAAYSEDQMLAYTRQVLLLNAGLMLVCDRIETAKPTQIKTWHLQLPNRPQVNGRDLPDSRRVHGTSQAGIWQYEGTGQTLATGNLDGRLFVRTLEPANAVWRVMGGPKKQRTVREGRHRDKPYFGGEPDGFEHRLLPAHVGGGSNAYYRLGKPTSLGEQFGLGALWGRLDVQVPEDQTAACVVHLLIPTDRRIAAMPETAWRVDGDTGTLTGTIARQEFRISVGLTGPLSGKVTLTDEISGNTVFEAPLTTKVEPAAPIPTAP